MAFAIPQSAIEEIKARIDLADLISSYGVKMRRSGANYMACCPFHHEKTPSFSIQPGKGFYHCFGCGESGDAIRFVQKQEGLTFVEAAKKLAGMCGVEIAEEEDAQAGLRKRLYALHAELAQFFRRCLKEAKEAARARAYLEDRDLDGEIAERFQLGYAPVASSAMLKWAEKYKYKPEELSAAGVLKPPRYAGDGWYNLFAGRLVFPINDRSGRVVAFSCRTLETDKAKMRGGKYVNSPESMIFKKSNVLYALDKAVPNIVKAPRREAIVCEGQIDVIRCHACGFNTAVASLGTAFTEEHAKLLRRHAESVVLAFDGDAAGQKAFIHTGGDFLSLETPVRAAVLPPGEDPDSFLRSKGAEAFRDRLENSISITAYQIEALRSREANPGQYDAVKRVATAALETMARCPSAIMRASLMSEAAKLLSLPLSALEEDFEKLRAKKEEVKAKGGKANSNALASENPNAPEILNSQFSILNSSVPASEDAGAEENNPPPKTELSFCAFLFENDRNAEMASVLASCAPDGIFAHEFTRRFVKAWRTETEAGTDAISALRAELPPAEAAWLDDILLGSSRSVLSELPPLRILEDYLRRFWSDAIRRRLSALPQATTPEADRARLSLTVLARKFRKAPWQQIVPQMTQSTLASCDEI